MFNLSNEIKKSAILTFFTRFFITVIVLQAIVYTIQSSAILSQSIQHAIANSVALFYNLFDASIVVDKNQLIHQSSARFLIVDNECTGLVLLASVCAAIVAFNKPWSIKIIIIMLAIMILQIENVFRISHLLFVIKKVDNDFNFYHLYFWQFINFITALIIIAGMDKLFKDQGSKLCDLF